MSPSMSCESKPKCSRPKWARASPGPSRSYTLWSGLIGGAFLAMAYFGADQSQVQRYLSARSLQESRLSLLFSGFLKVPMQFLILLTGVLVFVFYHFERPPLLWNAQDMRRLAQEAPSFYRRVSLRMLGGFSAREGFHDG